MLYYTMCGLWILIVSVGMLVFAFAIKETLKDIKNMMDDDNY